MDSGCIYQRAADAIRKLTDQRQNQGKLYPLSYLLIVIFAGVGDSLAASAVAEYHSTHPI